MYILYIYYTYIYIYIHIHTYTYIYILHTNIYIYTYIIHYNTDGTPWHSISIYLQWQPFEPFSQVDLWPSRPWKCWVSGAQTKGFSGPWEAREGPIHGIAQKHPKLMVVRKLQWLVCPGDGHSLKTFSKPKPPLGVACQKESVEQPFLNQSPEGVVGVVAILC